MNQFSLENKKILVTGASSGIGRQVAISLSEAGAIVFITGRNEERLLECYRKLKRSGHEYFIGDLTEDDQIKILVDKLPALNGVVFSAGITTHMPAKFIRKKDFSEIFEINYLTPVLLAGLIIKKKKLVDSSSLVFMSSIASSHPYFGGSLYSSSKAALESYSRTLALELSQKKIRSNCLSPGFVNTPMVEGAGNTISKEVLEEFEKMAPLGFGEPIDVANAALFLLSDASRWVTGITLPMGG